MNSLNGSYIAVKNNKIVTSKNKKEWSIIDGSLFKKNNNQWDITYETEHNGIAHISYKNNQYTLSCKKEKLYSDDGINWINKTI
jgi:hypothetical protein